MEQKNFCVSSLYNLLSPDGSTVEFSGDKYRLLRPSGLSNLHQIQFRDFKGDLQPFTNLKMPDLKADLIMLTNGLDKVDFEGENTLDLPAKFSYESNSWENKIITINKAWTYNEDEESQIIYNIQEIYNLMNNKLKDYFTKTGLYNMFNISLLETATFTQPTLFYDTTKTLTNRGFGEALMTNDKKLLYYNPSSSVIGECDVSAYDWVWLDTSKGISADRTGNIIIGGKNNNESTSSIDVYYYDCRTNFIGDELDVSLKLKTITRNKIPVITMRGISAGPNRYYNNFKALINNADTILMYGEGKKLYFDYILRGVNTGSYYENYVDLSDTTEDPTEHKKANDLIPYYDYIDHIIILTTTINSGRIISNYLITLNSSYTEEHNALYGRFEGPYTIGADGEITFTNWAIYITAMYGGNFRIYRGANCLDFLDQLANGGAPYSKTVEGYTATCYNCSGEGTLYTYEEDSELVLGYKNVKSYYTTYSKNLKTDGRITRIDTDGGFWIPLTLYYITTHSMDDVVATKTGDYWDIQYENFGVFANNGPEIFYNYDEPFSREMQNNALGVATTVETSIKCTTDEGITLNPNTPYLTCEDDELLTLENIEISNSAITGTASIPQITFSSDYSLNFVLRIYTDPYYFELYTTKNYTQEGNNWNLNTVSTPLLFRASNEHVLNTLEYLILLQYTYNDVILRVSGFPNNDQIIFHINETSYINFKTMNTDNTTQALIVELLSDEGEKLNPELLKKIFGKITLSIDWVQ